MLRWVCQLEFITGVKAWTRTRRLEFIASILHLRDRLGKMIVMKTFRNSDTAH